MKVMNWREQALRHLTIALGSMLCGISINAFYLPHHLLSGGVAGIAMILHFIADFPIGLTVFILNIPLLYAAGRFLEKSYFYSTLYGMIVFTAAIDLTRGISGGAAIDDIFLAAIYGGVISGVGSGLVFRVNGSLGGTDIVAVLLKKYYALNVSYISFFINCIIMSVAAFLFGFKPAMYTLLSMYAGANVIDRIVQGFNTKKTVIIISEKAGEIAAAIMEEVGRGVTFLHGQGGYTCTEKEVIFVVVTLTQIAKIKPIVNAVDSKAFMIVQEAVEVLGRGFTLPGEKMINR